MKFAVGAWIGVLGYALVYVGSAYFMGRTVSLSDALGFSFGGDNGLQLGSMRPGIFGQGAEALNPNKKTTTNLNNLQTVNA